jgi:hypothetical protein
MLTLLLTALLGLAAIVLTQMVMNKNRVWHVCRATPPTRSR